MPTTTVYPNCNCCSSSSSSSSSSYAGCCAGRTLPSTLHFEVTGCLTASGTMTDPEGDQTWSGIADDGSPIALYCGSSNEYVNGVWVVDWLQNRCSLAPVGPGPQVSCNPIDIVIVLTTFIGCPGCEPGATVTITITA